MEEEIFFLNFNKLKLVFLTSIWKQANYTIFLKFIPNPLWVTSFANLFYEVINLLWK